MSTTEFDRCEHCGAQFSLATQHTEHKPNCPTHHLHVRTIGAMNCRLCNAPPPLHSANCSNATTVASLAAKRFEKIGDPSAHEALSALDVARDWVLNHAEGAPDHIIVLIGRTTSDNSSGTKYFQAGSYPHHAQMGLCFEGMEMMRDSG